MLSDFGQPVTRRHVLKRLGAGAAVAIGGLLAARLPKARAATVSGSLQPSSLAIPMPLPAGVSTLGYNMQSSFTDLTALGVLNAGGATLARYQPGWSSVEDYWTGDLSLGSDAEAALAYCGQNGIQPVMVCAYGPPFSNVYNLTVGPDGASSGSSTIPISGSTSEVDTTRDYAMQGGNQIVAEGKWGYYGALIAGVSSNSITLASALTTSLSAGDTLNINRLRYASPADQSISNPSLVAYFRYLEFVASRLAANGCAGWCAIWNEPPWGHDPWHARGNFYDNPPAGMNTDDRMKVFLEYALTVTSLPAGVRIMNGSTDKTGGSSMLAQGLSPTSATVSENVSVESIHQYGNLPDTHMWNPPLTVEGGSYVKLNPTVDADSNFDGMAFDNAQANIGLTVMATEVGTEEPDDTRQAIWLARSVATCWGSNVIPIIYALTDGFDDPVGGLNVINPNTYAPRLAYTALQRLMNLVGSLGGPGGSAANIPSFLGYSGGTWPPYAVGVHGATHALLLVWQRTGHDTTTTWDTIDTPATYTCQFSLPSGASVVSATDIITGSSVPTSSSVSTLSLTAVGENVQAILIER
jgi:hypothetical protein